MEKLLQGCEWIRQTGDWFGQPGQPPETFIINLFHIGMITLIQLALINDHHLRMCLKRVTTSGKTFPSSAPSPNRKGEIRI